MNVVVLYKKMYYKLNKTYILLTENSREDLKKNDSKRT